MPHSFGYRARTRHLFKVDFRKHGVIALGTYMKTYKVGDYVDVIANSKIQKGMPHKFYHGRTGIVFNVTQTAVGVIVNKIVNGRIMAKRINVRIEHVSHSKCRDDFLNRVKSNEAKKAAVKKAGKAGVRVNLKRQNKQPRAGRTVKMKTGHVTEFIYPQPYEIIV